MKLLFKFNLVFILIFAVGFAVTGRVSWLLLERNAREEIAQSARLLMDTALAARGYTSSQVGPLLETQMKYTFLPQSVPAYSATEVFNELHNKHAEYLYKEAVLNPTNPRNRAVEWEADIVSQFRANKDMGEVMGDRDTPTGRSFYIARPIRIGNPACLRCHSTVDAAPKTMIERYGPANGFGWNLNEAIGAITRGKTSADWIEMLNKAGVPSGPIYKMNEVFADPQVKHLGMTRKVPHKVLGEVEVVGQPIELSRTPWSVRTATPEAGEHSDAILAELGYSAAEIAALRAAKAV